MILGDQFANYQTWNLIVFDVTEIRCISSSCDSLRGHSEPFRSDMDLEMRTHDGHMSSMWEALSMMMLRPQYRHIDGMS